MEEFFELAATILIFVIGFAAKNSKKKKAGKPKQPTASAWDALEDNVEKRFAEFINKKDGEPVIPYAPQPVQPAEAPAQPVIVPAQPAAAPAAPVVMAAPVPELHMEGAPAVPPMPKPRPVSRPAEPVQTAHSAHRSRLLPERINAGTLRSAVVMSEVLGRPVALKNAPRR